MRRLFIVESEASAMATIRIGMSGWRYPPWRGVFYPEKLTQAKELEYASRTLSSIELNGSFYSLQPPASFHTWHDATPSGFVFSVKAPRFITHIRRAKNVDGAVANFFASGLFALKEKLGPILWQFPPNFRFDAATLSAFLELLPHDTDAALKLAEKHEPMMKGRTFLDIDRKRTVRHAIEIRNQSFVDEAFVELLREHRVALVVADTNGEWPRMEDVTADFVYLRLHGQEALYTGEYSDPALDSWEARIRRWHDGGEPSDAQRTARRAPKSAKERDIYCYFDNDKKVKSPFDAQRLASRLGIDWMARHEDERDALMPGAKR
jgi:uncharacterized protein YecE (DUF72 family)